MSISDFRKIGTPLQCVIGDCWWTREGEKDSAVSHQPEILMSEKTNRGYSVMFLRFEISSLKPLKKNNTEKSSSLGQFDYQTPTNTLNTVTKWNITIWPQKFFSALRIKILTKNFVHKITQKLVLLLCNGLLKRKKQKIGSFWSNTKFHTCNCAWKERQIKITK